MMLIASIIDVSGVFKFYISLLCTRSNRVIRCIIINLYLVETAAVRITTVIRTWKAIGRVMRHGLILVSIMFFSLNKTILRCIRKIKSYKVGVNIRFC